jgi:membrane protein
MVLRIDGRSPGRFAAPVLPITPVPSSGTAGHGSVGLAHRAAGRINQVAMWMIRGYQQANAGDLAAAVAFNGLVALVPTFLLCLALAGVLLRRDEVLATAMFSSVWGLPPDAASDAFETVLSARKNSSWLGALSLAGFAWTGAGFVGSLGRAMNRVYGVSGCGYMCEKRRGFVVVVAFAVLFLLAMLASTVPTLFVAHDLPVYFERWTLAAKSGQVVSYGLAFVAAVGLFVMLYRVVPNAGQRLADVWPGTLTAAVLFVVMAQVFPVYLRLIGGSNRYGAVFGLVSLLVAWFYLLAHLLLFGTYVNATYRRHRQQRARAGQATPIANGVCHVGARPTGGDRTPVSGWCVRR